MSSTQASNSFHGFPTFKTFPPRLKPFEPAPLPASSVLSPVRGLKGIGPRRQPQPTQAANPEKHNCHTSCTTGCSQTHRSRSNTATQSHTHAHSMPIKHKVKAGPMDPRKTREPVTGHPTLCHYCGRKGHEEHECRTKIREEELAKITQPPPNADIESDSEEETTIFCQACFSQRSERQSDMILSPRSWR